MDNKQWIFGRHPVLEALQAGQAIEKVYLQQGTRGDFEKELRRICRSQEVPLSVIPKEKINWMVNGNHQGVVALQGIAAYQKLEDILPRLFEQSETPLLLLMDGVTDTRNFGAIARSAELFGVGAIVLPGKGSAGLTPDALKTSAGALSRIPVCRVRSMVSTVEYLQNNDVTVLASDLNGEHSLPNIDMKGAVALVLGSEGAGISKGVAKAVDDRFYIPQLGELNSLNVSVAAGIILYESMRQRTQK